MAIIGKEEGEDKALVDLIPGHTEVIYYKHKTGKTRNPDCHCGANNMLQRISNQLVSVTNSTLDFMADLIEEPNFKLGNIPQKMIFWRKSF